MITDDRLFLEGARIARIDPARLSLVAAPGVEPWLATDAEVQELLRLDSDDDSALITMTLKAARRYFEKITGLSLISQQWLASFDRLPGRGNYGVQSLGGGYSGGTIASREIELPRAPLLTVDKVQYRAETTGTLTDFASSNYSVGGIGQRDCFSRLWLNADASWPNLGDFPSALQVTFTAGFGAAATDVPEEIRLALLFLTAHWYENRLPADPDGSVELPLHLQSLIEMSRVAFIA